jgi:hypothetical protein
MVIGALVQSAHAQINPFGLLGFLDPEGSRLFPSALIAPRHPGKPDPRWRMFDWKYSDFDASGSKIRLFFYEEERWTARFALDELQTEAAYLKEQFNGFTPPQRFNYLLFTSHREFQQTNAFSLSEGVQGITSTQEPTMAIPYWGESETFKHISTHEMTHQFQVQKLNATNKWGSMRTDELTPLWFIEGMAEYYSLHGMDPETRAYMRDLVLYPNKDMGQIMPKFFEQPAYSFVQVYKAGQTKLDFLESTFGKGTIQKLLTAVDEKLGGKFQVFPELTATELNVKVDEIEKKWNAYIDKNFREALKGFKQKLEDFDEIKEIPDTVDTLAVSPDGKWMMTREIDEMTGVTSIWLRSTSDPKKKERVAKDFENENFKLYFMTLPTLAISNDHVLYFAETIRGPELVRRNYKEGEDGKPKLDGEVRYAIYKHDLIEAHSPAISKDGTKIAFVGLDKQGRANVFTLDGTSSDSDLRPKRLTSDQYSWKNLAWNESAIYGQSDRTADGKTAIFKINPDTGEFTQITYSAANQSEPDHASSGELVFTSLESGSSQIHLLKGGVEYRITDVPTAAMRPQLRGDTLYLTALKGGRYKVYRVPRSKWLNQFVRNLESVQDDIDKPPVPVALADLGKYDIQDYKPFRTSGTRIENLGGFLSTGTVIGVSAAVSDLMRDYIISGDFFLLGGIKNSEADLMLTNFRGRTKWTGGGYYTIRQQVDTQLSDSQNVRYYWNREFGGLFSLQYPFGPFDFMDAELRVAGVNRTDFSDPALQPEFNAQNPGTELLLAPTVRFGYDRVIYEAFTGPLKGYGVLLEGITNIYPKNTMITERGRIDAAYYYHVAGEAVLAFQGMGGAAWSLHNGTFLDSFFVSSPDIFRAYPFNDIRLLGNYVLGAKTEFRFPIGSLFKFPPLRGLLAADYGTIFVHPQNFGQGGTASFATGLNLNIPPLSIGFIFGFPIRVAPGPKDTYITHFILRYLYL